MKPITKSTFLKGCQCPKAVLLSLKRTGPALEIKNMEQWNEVELLARKLFPQGADLGNLISVSRGELLEKSGQALDNRVPVAYGLSFESRSGFCKTDIAVNSGKGLWVYEVKSTTKVTDEHITDCAFQSKIITESGTKLLGISVVHLNPGYVRRGELDYDELFVVEDVTECAKDAEPEISARLDELKKVIEGEDCPDVDIGIHCDEPRECEFKSICWSHIPEKSVFSIGGLRKTVKFSSYSSGIIGLDQIPEGMGLNEKQLIQVRCGRSNETHIDNFAVRMFLDLLRRYPICFLDFETFNPAIPRFEGTKPYQQVPFQYSLHIQRGEGATPEHRDFIASPDLDPRRKFVETLLADTKDVETIVVYNAAFETTVMNRLAEAFPDLAGDIFERIDKVVDLMVPFRDRSYYHPAMNGSYSIKKVLPAMVPDFNYDSLEIGNGDDASIAYASMKKMPNEERQKVILQLREYCAMDTLAMVKVLEALLAESERAVVNEQKQNKKPK